MRKIALILLTVAIWLPDPRPARAADSAQERYEAAVAREERLRSSTPTLRQLRSLISAYDDIVRRYPRSGYSDNALWQGAGLALEAYQRFGNERDRSTGLRMLEWLVSEYPSSSLRGRTPDLLQRLGAPQVAAVKETSPPPARPRRPPPPRSGPVMIRNISRSQIGDMVRITVEMDAEVQYREERLSNPARIFFDLKGARPVPDLVNARLTYDDDRVVREIRLGQHPEETTRVVVDMAGVSRYAVFSVYDPFRLVIDCVSGPESLTARAADPQPMRAGGASPLVPAGLDGGPVPAKDAGAEGLEGEATPSVPAVAATTGVPAEPAANSSGDFSLARQLGLGVSRIVIDPGHGGRDPGAKGSGIWESELVLDVALRLEKLLKAQPGFEVVMTRRTDTFVPLEERTAIANRETADLFLSVHANASRKRKVGGVETYYLNFATNPEAEAVAARENSSSGRSMRSLPDIVQAIALNNKLDESRDFAQMVQNAMIGRLRAQHKQLRNLGVKQAPFVVLIGAKMPSVLAEVSFVTNDVESRLLRTDTYRQRAAQALLDAILGYRSSLKKVEVAQQQ